MSGLGEDAALARLDLADLAAKVRRHAELRYGARSRDCERRVMARVEASAQGVDCRFV